MHLFIENPLELTKPPPTGPKIPSSTDLGGRGNAQNLNAAIGGGVTGQVCTTHTPFLGMMLNH